MFKLAIHEKKGSFSDRWIQYCNKNNIPYKLVNCYSSKIIHDLQGVHGLLWHWSHFEPDGQLVARQLIAAIKQMGIIVFPNIDTCWHYDDKVAQKYLMEAISAPMVPSHVFLNISDALEFIENATYPLVFKLRCGAGSQNVQWVHTKKEAKKLCHKAFNKGFSAAKGYFSDAKTKIRKVESFNALIEKAKRLPVSLKNIVINKKLLSIQKGYIYFQDFIPNNTTDTRITVIGDRAFGFQRKVRPGDFRASGSGHIVYDTDQIDLRCVEISFQVSKQLNTQSLSFDYIFDQNNHPKICEISYCYQNKAVYDCPGYWDQQLNWKQGHVWPEDAILSDLIRECSPSL
ncbi:MAG: hypothetical protein HQK75_15120 [Candidatus Magnetomorum sp.]|nr:hypothetical protein [Candidatus Magnetomorum sp.]